LSVLVVAGTDTGVGKTVVTAALAALACARGERVAVVKPAQTGVASGAPGDLDEIRRLTGIEDIHELARFPDPLAPATAARLAKTAPPTIAQYAAAIEQLLDRDLVLVEGSGGVLVHLDASGGTLADLALALCAPVVVVARAGLGTLNHTALTCEELRGRGVECGGVVVGAWPEDPDLAAICNLDDLPVYAGVRVLGRLPENAGVLDPETFLAVASEGLTAEVLA
jgi:dethiobiotin synthetase